MLPRKMKKFHHRRFEYEQRLVDFDSAMLPGEGIVFGQHLSKDNFQDWRLCVHCLVPSVSSHRGYGSN